MSPRRPSPLEDDELVEIDPERNPTSSGDVCERCGCARGRHGENGCTCGKCDEFIED
jgi:hypothetical protein